MTKKGDRMTRLVLKVMRLKGASELAIQVMLNEMSRTNQK